MTALRHFLLALQFFTRIPVTGRLAEWVGFSPAMLRASAAYFPLVGMVIGGVATLSGALWGALFIQFIPNLADEISKAAPWAIYGVSMIAFMYLMPMGIAGALALLSKRLSRH
jgi:ABC-type branched-subunit amino acid transport system permease subunit